jgi:hypothetical protein
MHAVIHIFFRDADVKTTTRAELRRKRHGYPIRP